MTRGSSWQTTLAQLAIVRSRARLGRVVMLWFGLPLIIELVGWQAVPLQSGAGLDPSWQVSLEMAVHQHLAFGTAVVFTYGPLGFLSVPEWYGDSVWFSGLAVLALANLFVIRFALAAVVLASARRMYGLRAGVVISVVVVCFSGAYADLCVLLIVLVGGLCSNLSTRATIVVSIGGGAFAAVELLEKVSIGASACVLVALFVGFLSRDRVAAAVATILVFVSVLILAWLSVGQPLGSLGPYLHAAEQISSGYSAALELSLVGGWVYAVGLLVGVAGALVAWKTMEAQGKRQRIGVVLLWLVFYFTAMKESFVRADSGHAEIVFFAAMSGLFALGWSGHARSSVLALSVLALFCGLLVEDQSASEIINQPRGVAWAYRDIRDVMDPSIRGTLINGTRATVIAKEGLPPAALTLLRGRTVAAYPWENVLIWAYGLHWRPIPVLGSYSAYTSWLDRLDANFLSSSKAPSRVIVQDTSGQSIDSRVLSFDEPEAAMQIFCRYRVLMTSRLYAILGRSSNRCSAEHELNTVRAGWDQTVDVPVPPTSRSIVLVKIEGVQVRGLESIKNVLWKPAMRFIRLNNQAQRRLVGGTADDGLPLLAARGVDFPSPYSVTAGAHTISVTKAGQAASTNGSHPITYSFYAVTVS